MRCDYCGYDEYDDGGPKRTFAECDRCGVLCSDCLHGRATANGSMQEHEADRVNDSAGGAGFILECESTGAVLCPKCMATTKEDSNERE